MKCTIVAAAAKFIRFYFGIFPLAVLSVEQIKGEHKKVNVNRVLFCVTMRFKSNQQIAHYSCVKMDYN